MQPLSLRVAALYLVASLVTFAVYARDKAAARKDRWRTPERTLHLLALLGGWPGALAARHLLRHKSRKVSFRVLFWLSVLANCLLLIFLLHRGDFLAAATLSGR